MLEYTKPPFFIAVFFISLGWSINWFTTNLEKSPSVIYQMTLSEPSCKDCTESEALYCIKVFVKNMTKNIVFDSVKFMITGGDLTNGEIEKIAPSWHSTKSPEGDETTSIYYTIKRFHPGESFFLNATSESQAKPEFYLLESHQALRLIKKNSIESRLLEYKEMFVFGLLGIWGLTMIIYYNLMSNKIETKK